jgi:membrane protein implicated in regulation of membrane protease activity
MAWWIWVVIGLVLLICEVLTPGGFYIFFFGFGGLILGVLMAFFPNLHIAYQLLLFSTVSVILLLLFRKPLLFRFQSRHDRKDIDGFVGGEAVVLKPMNPHETGVVEYRGTPWKAVNSGVQTLSIGMKCRIDRVDGICLEIRNCDES